MLMKIFSPIPITPELILEVRSMTLLVAERCLALYPVDDVSIHR